MSRCPRRLTRLETRAHAHSFPRAYSEAVGDRPPSIPKIHFVGDSITFHVPYDKLGWTGRWGMAATSEANDYPRRLAALTSAHQGSAPELIVNATGGGTLPAKLSKPEALTSVKVDVIVIQMG